MIQNYFEWLNSTTNIAYFVTTNFLLAIFIFLVCWIISEIIDYFYLKEDVKKLKENVKKLEKRKKK